MEDSLRSAPGFPISINRASPRVRFVTSIRSGFSHLVAPDRPQRDRTPGGKLVLVGLRAA